MKVLAVASLALALVVPDGAAAYSRGVSFHGCEGCHGLGDHDVDVTPMPSVLAPGERVTVRIVVTGDGAVTGLYATADAGDVDAVSGGGLARTDDGVTHDGPRTVSGGSATFEMGWTAPTTPGAVRFDISSVLGNGNGRSSGDGAVERHFDFVFGCEPQVYYRDFDGDGHGRMDLTRTHCAGGAPEGYAEVGDDCNDSDSRAYAGADDLCNGRDDDCDGEVDEGAEPVTNYPDADGDGYYSRMERESGETMFGCGISGWASEGTDCAPEDPAVHPGAEETCNLIDDDCDADVDERVRPQCGQGWCRRNAFSCEVEDCAPGEPRDEECNYFDDDCDGGIDEGSCPAGQVCFDFECIDEDEAPRPDAGAPDAPSGSSGGGCATAGGGATLPLVALVALLFVAIRRRGR